MDAKEILERTESVLVIDWPSREVPELLALAGFRVTVRNGPGPEDYAAFEVGNGEVTVRRTGRAPERADLIYAYRPPGELPQIIATAKSLGTRTIWTQSGLSSPGVKDPKGYWLPDDELQAARELIESAGLTHVSEPYIGDIARQISTGSTRAGNKLSPECAKSPR